MSYTKKVWISGEIITSKGLNHIEDGIFSEEQRATSVEQSLGQNISDEATRAINAETQLSNRITQNTSAITTLNGDSTVQGSVDYKILNSQNFFKKFSFSWTYKLEITLTTGSGATALLVTSQGTILLSTSGNKVNIAGIDLVDSSIWTYLTSGLKITLNCTAHWNGILLTANSDAIVFATNTSTPQANAFSSVSASKISAKLNSAKMWIGSCATVADTAAKEITVDNEFILYQGVTIAVKYTNTNSASNCTINVNGTGAYPIWYSNAAYTGSSNLICGYADRYTYYTFDGTYWVWVNSDIENNTTYSVFTTSSNGLVPKATNTSKYLKGDGTWDTPSGTTYNVVSTSSNGLAPQITNTSGYLKGDGTWSVPPGTTYNVVSTTENGLAPKVTNANGYLKGDGTWTEPPGGDYSDAVKNITRGSGSDICKFTCTQYDDTTFTFSQILGAAYCNTAADVAAKTALATGYQLTSKTYTYITITTTNTYAGALTLSINGKTAKPIYINGSASSDTNYSLTRGTYLVYYNGTNYYFRTDGKLTASITGNCDGTVNGHSVNADVPSGAVFTDTRDFMIGTSVGGATADTLYFVYTT